MTRDIIKIINKLQEQLDKNQYVLYLSKTEYKKYNDFLKAVDEITNKEFPQEILEQKVWYGDAVGLNGKNIPTSTYKAHPIKYESSAVIY